jgi:hypothetical protein
MRLSRRRACPPARSDATQRRQLDSTASAVGEVARPTVRSMGNAIALVSSNPGFPDPRRCDPIERRSEKGLDEDSVVRAALLIVL